MIHVDMVSLRRDGHAAKCMCYPSFLACAKGFLGVSGGYGHRHVRRIYARLICYFAEQVAIVSDLTDLKIIPGEHQNGFLQISGGYRHHYFEEAGRSFNFNI